MKSVFGQSRAVRPEDQQAIWERLPLTDEQRKQVLEVLEAERKKAAVKEEKSEEKAQE